jgi:hypothetical protein
MVATWRDSQSFSACQSADSWAREMGAARDFASLGYARDSLDV